MHVIDQDEWPRRTHFDLYHGFEFAHVNLCVQIDITDLWTHRAKAGASPTVTLLYVITKAANRVPEMRQRIHGGEVVEYEIIHPQVTVLGEDELFGVVTLSYDEAFGEFAAKATKFLAQARKQTSMEEFAHDPNAKAHRDDLLSITILPWLAFTGFAITRRPKDDCIPLVAFGKVQASDSRYLLPFFVNFHHALADGLHVARFIRAIEEEADEMARSLP